jgi:hypothetical protein
LAEPERISTHVSAIALSFRLTPVAIRVGSAEDALPVVAAGAVVG